MHPVIAMLIANVLGNPALQDPAAGLIAEALAKALPDVTEDVLGGFLVKVGKKLTDINP